MPSGCQGLVENLVLFHSQDNLSHSVWTETLNPHAPPSTGPSRGAAGRPFGRTPSPKHPFNLHSWILQWSSLWAHSAFSFMPEHISHSLWIRYCYERGLVPVLHPVTLFRHQKLWSTPCIQEVNGTSINPAQLIQRQAPVRPEQQHCAQVVSQSQWRAPG